MLAHVRQPHTVFLQQQFRYLPPVAAPYEGAPHQEQGSVQPVRFGQHTHPLPRFPQGAGAGGIGTAVPAHGGLHLKAGQSPVGQQLAGAAAGHVFRVALRFHHHFRTVPRHAGIPGHGAQGVFALGVFRAVVLAQHGDLRMPPLHGFADRQGQHVVDAPLVPKAQHKVGHGLRGVVRAAHHQRAVRREPRPHAVGLGHLLQGVPRGHARFHGNLLAPVSLPHPDAADAQRSHDARHRLFQVDLPGHEQRRGAIHQHGGTIPTGQGQGMLPLANGPLHPVDAARQYRLTAHGHGDGGPRAHRLRHGVRRNAQRHAPRIGGGQQVAVQFVAGPVAVFPAAHDQGDGVAFSGHSPSPPNHDGHRRILRRMASRWPQARLRLRSRCAARRHPAAGGQCASYRA
ncbi:hypothetical protein DSECCO2_538440 [anaerobic digester metagenome]